MTKEIKITVTAPIECTEEQFEEWVKFNVGYQSTMDADNPLAEESMDCHYISF